MMLRHAPGLLLILLVLGGCATKRDLRDLRTEIDTLRAAQAEALREIQQQNAMILDSLSIQDVRLRGDLTNQLVQIERQLVQIQELTGQGQAQLSQIREQIRAREEAAASVGAPAASGSPEELFDTSLEALDRGSLTTARAGFEEFLRSFPQHPLAGDAQFHIGETYVEAEDAENALVAFARVLELYPASARAPTALYRAGTLELERGNEDQARSLFDRIVSAYPDSPEAPLAREELEELG